MHGNGPLVSTVIRLAGPSRYVVTGLLVRDRSEAVVGTASRQTRERQIAVAISHRFHLVLLDSGSPKIVNYQPRIRVVVAILI